jgi:hypothetical protein
MPPDNGSYMVAAYVVTAVILVGYALSLMMRAKRADRRTGGRADGKDGRV